MRPTVSSLARSSQAAMASRAAPAAKLELSHLIELALPSAVLKRAPGERDSVSRAERHLRARVSSLSAASFESGANTLCDCEVELDRLRRRARRSQASEHSASREAHGPRPAVHLLLRSSFSAADGTSCCTCCDALPLSCLRARSLVDSAAVVGLAALLLLSKLLEQAVSRSSTASGLSQQHESTRGGTTGEVYRHDTKGERGVRVF